MFSRMTYYSVLDVTPNSIDYVEARVTDHVASASKYVLTLPLPLSSISPR